MNRKGRNAKVIREGAPSQDNGQQGDQELFSFQQDPAQPGRTHLSVKYMDRQDQEMPGTRSVPD